MEMFRFGTCEFCFPIWGRFAMEAAHEAGFHGIQITDGGGYLQPHPLNNGFVEYERFGLDLRRKDSYPLLDKWVQEDYLAAAQASDMEITGIYLYLLNHQGFVKFSDLTPQGEQCRETIHNAVKAAAQMGIPSVTVPAFGMFGVGQHTYALKKLEFAVEVGEEYGVQIYISTDMSADRQKEVVEHLHGRAKLDFCTIDPIFSNSGAAPKMIQSLGGNYIGRYRLRDALADREGFVTREESGPALLGQGDGCVQACSASILQTGYRGWIFSETPYYSQRLRRNGEDCVCIARQDRTALENMFGGKERGEQRGEI